MGEINVTVHTIGASDEMQLLLMQAVQNVLIEAKPKRFTVSVTPLDNTDGARVAQWPR